MAPQIIESKWPHPEFVRQNLYELITSNPNNVPDDKAAFIRAADGKAFTRGQMFRDARRLAHAYIHKLKLKKGDRIGVFSPNSCFYPVVMWAGFISGVVLVPMNPGYGASELVHPAHDSAFKYLFVHPSTLKVGKEGLKEAGSNLKTQEGLNNIWLISDSDSLEKGDAGEQDVRSLLGNEEMQPIKVDDPENTLAFIAYSSGTTGRSKGTLLTHYNMTSNCCLLKVMFKGFVEANDIQLGVLPFQHIFALSKNISHAPFVGCPVVVLPKFDLTAWLEAVQRYKITVTMIVPPILVLLAKSPIVDKYDLTSLRAVMSGAAPLSAELGDEVEQRIKTLKVTQGYGLTETSPTVSYTPPEIYKHCKGSAGRLAPGVEMRLVDDEGKDVGFEQGEKGKPGELWFRGPNIFKGYLNNKEATADCMTSDGFFKSGDVAIYLKDQIYIVDRKKELIKYKGFQVAPAELEALLLQHPKVADAAVLGLYSKDEATELPRAYIVPREGLVDLKDTKACEELAKEVRTWADGKVANHKKLRAGVRVLEQIPKSPSGKILRRVLKDQAAAEGGAIRAKL